MNRKLMLIAVAIASMLGGIVWALSSGAGAGGPCGGPSGGGDARGRLARGTQLAAAVSGSLRAVDADSAAVEAPGPAAGVVRDVASREGSGTAFVRDMMGPDTIVIATPAGTVELPQQGEASDPAWSDGGRLVWSTDGSLRLWSAHGGPSARIIRPPSGAVGVFGPAFSGDREITAVASEAVADVPTEDELLNDLWTYDLRDREWRKITSFTADRDRWVAIRTLVATPRGALEFVRILGRASLTTPPSFELWEYAHGRATKLRDLDGEMYLAGYIDDQRVWNRWDATTGEWRLYIEEAGRSRDVGCGRVLVDPRAEPDPDKAPGGGSSDPATSGATTRSVPTATRAILVGDFGSSGVARGVRDAISAAYPGGKVRMLTDDVAPTVVAPGVFAVVLALPAEADAQAALAAFRERFPDYSGQSWVVTLA
jgi:hypothetical protein